MWLQHCHIWFNIDLIINKNLYFTYEIKQKLYVITDLKIEGKWNVYIKDERL